MTLEDFQLITTDWQHNKELKQIRSEVFIKEQHVPENLEWDDFDIHSIHFLVHHNDFPVATARLKPDGQIGRMAVIKNYRHKGIGKKLLSAVILYARENGYKMIYLHAQKQVVDFYNKHSFICNGNEFLDAGILHQAMYKQLT